MSDITPASNSPHPSMDKKTPELEQALAEYCDLVDRGVVVDRDEFLSRCAATMRDELRECLCAFDFIREAAPRVDNPANMKPSEVPFQLGDFHILSEIGRGGMGVVYEAEQVSLRRRVAVKVLPFAALLDRRQLARFRNEARAAAILKHPHIVSVLSVGFERGVHFYAMELVEGCSLAEVIQQIRAGRSDASPALSNRDTLPLAALSTAHSEDRQAFFRSVAKSGIQAAKALKVAHDAGIVHRDIKPSNSIKTVRSK